MGLPVAAVVDETAIQRLCKRIAEEFDPDRIVLFGSHAAGLAKRDSDVDLLVILRFEGKGLAKSLEILNRVNPEFSVDLIARRPEDTERRYQEGDPLIREALDHGRVLYERNGQRVAGQG
jgi:predicted nucleotidyltransferase